MAHYQPRLSIRSAVHSPPVKGGDSLTITLSVVLGLSVVVVQLCRYAGLRLWHAAICIVLGFYLASSSLAPDISQFTTSLFRML